MEPDARRYECKSCGNRTVYGIAEALMNGSVQVEQRRKEVNTMDLVLKLRELRRMRGLTQQEAAQSSGVGWKTLSSFETRERIGSMKLSQLLQLRGGFFHHMRSLTASLLASSHSIISI